NVQVGKLPRDLLQCGEGDEPGDVVIHHQHVGLMLVDAFGERRRAGYVAGQVDIVSFRQERLESRYCKRLIASKQTSYPRTFHHHSAREVSRYLELFQINWPLLCYPVQGRAYPAGGT